MMTYRHVWRVSSASHAPYIAYLEVTINFRDQSIRYLIFLDPCTYKRIRYVGSL